MNGVPQHVVPPLRELEAAWTADFVKRTGESIDADRRAGLHQPLTQRQRFSSGLPHPIYIDSGEGAHFVDLDGNRYLDLTAGWNAAILGRGTTAVRDAVGQSLGRVGAPGGAMHPTLARDELAQRLCTLIPGADRVLFAPSGSEANTYAVRLARAFTGRRQIVRMRGGYHGQYDYLVGGQSSRLGLPDAVGNDVIEVPFNDIDACREAIAEAAATLAAVFVEPMMTIPGAVHQQHDFLSQLRAAALDHDVLFVVDEVLTGLRFDRRGAAHHYRLAPAPDLIVMGKMLGGGLPVAAVLGSADVLETRISASNTHAHNDACMAAALAMLAQLTDADFSRLRAQGKRLRAGLRATAMRLSTPLVVTGDGPCVGLHFTDEAVVDFDSACRGDQELWRLMCLGMARSGFAISSRTFGPILPFTDANIDECLDAFEDTLSAIDRSRSR